MEWVPDRLPERIYGLTILQWILSAFIFLVGSVGIAMLSLIKTLPLFLSFQSYTPRGYLVS